MTFTEEDLERAAEALYKAQDGLEWEQGNRETDGVLGANYIADVEVVLEALGIEWKLER